MQDLSAQVAGVELRYNADHIPSGPGGGQFTGPGGSGGAPAAKPPGKPAAPKPPAPPPKVSKAAEKAQLLAQANADQQRITALQAQLAQVNALLGAAARGPVQHKAASTKVTHVANPTAKPKGPAKARTTAKASSSLSRAQKLGLQQEKVTLTTEIGALTAQETALRAQAASL